jgi:hypothetical protein
LPGETHIPFAHSESPVPHSLIFTHGI